jgi:hypothetical protein
MNPPRRVHIAWFKVVVIGIRLPTPGLTYKALVRYSHPSSSLYAAGRQVFFLTTRSPATVIFPSPHRWSTVPLLSRVSPHP